MTQAPHSAISVTPVHRQFTDGSVCAMSITGPQQRQNQCKHLEVSLCFTLVTGNLVATPAHICLGGEPQTNEHACVLRKLLV